MATPFTMLPPAWIIFSLNVPNLPINAGYKAVITPKEQRNVAGSIIKFDGKSSVIPGPNPQYYWSFLTVPIGSQVGRFGLQPIDQDNSSVKFSPDITGPYQIALQVGDANFNSEVTVAEVYVSYIEIPYGEGIVPDMSFLWNYLGDFWNLFKDKEVYSTIWSAYNQIGADKLLELYQTQYNDSPVYAQYYFQKRWLNYNPSIEIENAAAIIGEDHYGSNAILEYPLVSSTDNFTNYCNLSITTQQDNGFVKTPSGFNIGKRLLLLRDKTYLRKDSYNGYFSNNVLTIQRSLFESETPIINEAALQYWRFLSTIDVNKNVEELGIGQGDIIELTVQLKGNRESDIYYGSADTLISTIQLPIISCSKQYVGFNWNFEKLINNQSAGELDNSIIFKLAEDLKISGINKGVNNNVIYTPNTLGSYLYNKLTSLEFKRRFYEKEIKLGSNIDLGFYNGQNISLKVDVIRLIRNNKILIDKEIRAIPTLQEYIKTPATSTIDGNIYIIQNGIAKKVDRDPLFLFENLDYTVSSDTLDLDITLGVSKNVLAKFGDLLDRRVEVGDILRIRSGPNKGKEFVITEVSSKEDFKINFAPTYADVNAQATIIRNTKGNFLRFVKNVFNTPNINLWADVSLLDNSGNIENNFGKLIKYSREDLIKRKIKTPYRDVVAGLMYALAKGPSINNIKMGAQIILGLPFSFHKGKIIEINPDYKLNNDFSPKQGRIVISEIDNMGNFTGLTETYFYPRGRQIKDINGNWIAQDPNFSGIAINPKTNKEYAVGDIVEIFAPLSKGIEIYDYYSNPEIVEPLLTSPELKLRKYHTFYFKVNADLFTIEDVAFLVAYLKQVKASHVFFRLIFGFSFIDVVLVTDKLTINVGLNLFDSTGLGLPVPLSANFTNNESKDIVTVDNDILSRRLKGNDLVTTFNSFMFSTASGGLESARTSSPYNERHDSPYLYIGGGQVFLRIYGGPNDGIYSVGSILSDVSGQIGINTLTTATAQKFSIYKKLDREIFKGECIVAQNTPIILINSGLLSAGVSPGDKILFFDSTDISRIYRINTVNLTQVEVDSQIIEISGPYEFVIFREKLQPKSLLSQYGEEPFLIKMTNGDPLIEVSVANLARLNIQKGDTIYPNGYPPFEILDWNNITKKAYVTPTPTTTTIVAGKIWRNKYYDTIPTDLDYVSLTDILKISILPNTLATTISGNYNVSFSAGTDLITWGIVPGDFYRALAGPDSAIDYGYGVGMIPIAEVVALNQLKLTRPLTATQNLTTYEIIRIVD